MQSVYAHFKCAVIKHHLLQMLLNSHQHLLPTRSVLHPDDPSHTPHAMELHCPGKEQRSKTNKNKYLNGLFTIISVHTIHGRTNKLSHPDLHQILLYSYQHLLPTRSVLHPDDPSDMPHAMEMLCPGKKQRSKTNQNKYLNGLLTIISVCKFTSASAPNRLARPSTIP